MPLIICFNGGYERYLVFRSPTNSAASAFTTKVSVINFNAACEDRRLLSLEHNLHNLVLHTPSSSIADAQDPS